MEEKINLDEHLDYRKLFTAIVEKPTVSGDSLTGCCPIHKDSNPSFSVNLKTGQCKCFSCGWSGNYVSLYAQLHGLTSKDAFKEILHQAGLDSAPAAKPVRARCSRSPSALRRKNTQAAPSVVPRNGMRIP